jgi:hypothetical protein
MVLIIMLVRRREEAPLVAALAAPLHFPATPSWLALLPSLAVGLLVGALLSFSNMYFGYVRPLPMCPRGLSASCTGCKRAG